MSNPSSAVPAAAAAEDTAAAAAEDTAAPAAEVAAAAALEVAAAPAALEIGAARAEPPGRSTSDRGKAPARRAFQIKLDQFEGPFDLLLSLITKRELDLTSISLSTVTDEFIAHIRSLGSAWELEQATEFLVVAATLLDLKVARLLPQAEVEDPEDLALLEARDLLFARLLQYRAYKQAASLVATLLERQGRHHPRVVQLEPPFDQLVPEVSLGVDLAGFAVVAVRALAPRPIPLVNLDHVHAPMVSVREQAELLRRRLPGLGRATFRALVADCGGTLQVVGRFLALLELYREGSVLFDQVDPLGELLVRWTGQARATEDGTAIDDQQESTKPVIGTPVDDEREDGDD